MSLTRIRYIKRKKYQPFFPLSLPCFNYVVKRLFHKISRQKIQFAADIFVERFEILLKKIPKVNSATQSA